LLVSYAQPGFAGHFDLERFDWSTQRMKLLHRAEKRGQTPREQFADGSLHRKRRGQTPFFNSLILCAMLILVAGGCTPSEPASKPAAAPLTGSVRQEAINVIKSAFASDQPVQCVYACEVVADAGLKEMAPTVQKQLRARTIPVRFAAAMALGDLKYVQARSALQEAQLDTDENVRMAATYALIRFGADVKNVKLIYEGLSNTEPTIRANAALILGKLKDQAALTALYWAMSDKQSDQDTRTQIAYSIAQIGDEKIYPTLWTLLINSFANYRIQGIDAMGVLNDAQARTAVYTMLRDDVLDVRLAAAEQLGVMGDNSGEKIVLEYLQKPDGTSDPAELERRTVRAARAIGAIGTPQLKAFLPQLLQDKSPIVRLSAAKSALELKP
jgi:HEAT repeat protein